MKHAAAHGESEAAIAVASRGCSVRLAPVVVARANAGIIDAA
jgi:hypothetical protein